MASCGPRTGSTHPRRQRGTGPEMEHEVFAGASAQGWWPPAPHVAGVSAASLSFQHLWQPPRPPGISGGLPVSCPPICCPPGVSGFLPFSCPPFLQAGPSCVSPSLPALGTGDWDGVSPGTHTTPSSQAQTPWKPQMLLRSSPHPWKPCPLAGPGPMAAPWPRQQAGSEDWPAATAPHGCWGEPGLRVLQGCPSSHMTHPMLTSR